MQTTDVFTPTRIPTVTFIRDHLVEREKILKESLMKGGTLISVSGPSKSGKTAFIKDYFGSANVVPVSGANISNTGDVWMQVFHQIGTPLERIRSITSEHERTTSTKGSIEGNVFFAKGSVDAGLSNTTGSGETITEHRPVTFLQLLVEEMANSGSVIFIDDFHYINRETQAVLAKEIKSVISEGVQIVCASVPYRSEDVLRANDELQGRLVGIDFDYWSVDVLSQIAERGFNELKVEVEPSFIRDFAVESAGSPQLMQSLCLEFCFMSGVYETRSDSMTYTGDVGFFRSICERTAATVDYSTTVEKMNVGPRIRGQPRNHYRTLDGGVEDVYGILLKAISQDPPRLHFPYADLIARVGSICEKDSPSGSSITTACAQLAAFANAGKRRNLVDWSSENDVFDIREPLLLFYLRWSGWADRRA